MLSFWILTSFEPHCDTGSHQDGSDQFVLGFQYPINCTGSPQDVSQIQSSPVPVPYASPQITITTAGLVKFKVGVKDVCL